MLDATFTVSGPSVTISYADLCKKLGYKDDDKRVLDVGMLFLKEANFLEFLRDHARTIETEELLLNLDSLLDAYLGWLMMYRNNL